jgi:hypothetical protein
VPVDQEQNPWRQISPEVIITEFKYCCISDEIDGREDEEEVGNVGIEHKSVSTECELRKWQL